MKRLPTFLFYFWIINFNFCVHSCQKVERVDESEFQDTSIETDDNFGQTEHHLAKAHFEKGLFLLHTFAYKESRDEFQKARNLDSSFVLAYWGEALTYNQSFWQKQDLINARNTINALGKSIDQRLQKCTDAVEARLIQSLDILFGPLKKFDRDIAYSDFLGELIKEHEEHIELEALYALSLISSPHYDRIDWVYDEAIKVTKRALRISPDHPGLMHYSILALDQMNRTKEAKREANQFIRIAPNSSHAQHIGSHVHLALAEWNKVIQSNIKSWNTSLNKSNINEWEKDMRSYHALYWLMYSYLQKGWTSKAKLLLDQMESYIRTDKSKACRSHMLLMIATYQSETLDFDEKHKFIDSIYIGDLHFLEKVGYAYLKGLRSFYQDDIEGITYWANRVEETRIRAQNFLVEEGVALCLPVGYYYRPTTRSDLQQAEVMKLQLLGMRSSLRNEIVMAESWYQKAVDLESQIEMPIGPPSIFKPSYELIGSFYLDHNMSQLALINFKAAQLQNPGRLVVLNGLKKSAAKRDQALSRNVSDAIKRQKSKVFNLEKIVL